MLLIGNAKVVTQDMTCPFIKDGAVAIEGSLIKETGQTTVLRSKYPNAEYIDANNKIVMPGFINTHMHYYSTFARGINLGTAPSKTFGEVLENLWWKLDKMLTLEDVYYSCMGPMIDQIRAGVTSVIDHHASPFAIEGSLFKIAEAAKLFGLRSNLCYEVSDRDGEEIAMAGIKENIDFAKYCKQQNDDILTSLFGLHAQMTLSDKTLTKCTEAALTEDIGFHIHTAEGIEDLQDCLSKYNMRVIQRLKKHGILSQKSIAVHCIHIDEKEMDILKESGTAVVHNPQSNMGNAVGTAPILQMLKKGILAGLGTDGYSADITDSFKTAAILHKHANKDPSVFWQEPNVMLFENNKKIMENYIKGKVGTIAKDCYADIIIVDYKSPTPINEDTIYSHMLFGQISRLVDTVIINGKVIMQDRVLLNIDETALLAKSCEQAKKLWKRI